MTSTGRTWNRSPESLSLTAEDVHVWIASLDRNPSELDSLRQILTPDERKRADRFRFEKRRDRFIVGRGALRTILGRYLDQRPNQLRFQYSRYGKPRLSTKANMINFNLSHSRDLALYAVAQGREIGVDLEFIRTSVDALGIAKRFFSEREYSQLRALPQRCQLQAFFDCWTRKEAFIKAKGAGFSLPLRQFDVSLAPGEPAALLCTAWDPDEAARWSLKSLAPISGYAAALAVEGKHWRLRSWSFDLA